MVRTGSEPEPDLMNGLVHACKIIPQHTLELRTFLTRLRLLFLFPIYVSQ